MKLKSLQAYLNFWKMAQGSHLSRYIISLTLQTCIHLSLDNRSSGKCSTIEVLRVVYYILIVCNNVNHEVLGPIVQS